jgi:dienelactone hydrolase
MSIERWTRNVLTCAFLGLAADGFGTPGDSSLLPGTEPLTFAGDFSLEIVEGADRYLLRELERSLERRASHWKRDVSSAEAYERSVAPNRRRLAHILGVRDARPAFEGPELAGSTARSPLAATADSFQVFNVRWPAFGDVRGEGLLLVPKGSKPIAEVIAVPDADQTPEQISGLAEGVPPESQYARRLAESGCRVIVPVLVSRGLEQRRNATLTNREYLYRSAFELGRHLIGYEIQKILACADWFEREASAEAPGDGRARATSRPKIGIIGWGEGGLLALYSAALDRRIEAACVSGYFDSRQRLWEEPIDRNVFGLLERFGDAELASLVSPRPLILEAARGPELTVEGKGGAPGRLVTPRIEDVEAEVSRARALVDSLKPPARIELIRQGDGGTGAPGSAAALEAFLDALAPGAKLAPPGKPPDVAAKPLDAQARQNRQIHEIDRHNQLLLRESPYVRAEFFSKLDTRSLDGFRQSVEQYRQLFRDEVIGRFDEELLPPRPRSRKAYEREAWTGYEVVLDVFPDVNAYGILLLPKDIGPGERRPVVVCQHGLEGRPQQVIEGDVSAYRDFAARLAERGFITFAPQNLYIHGDRFRTLQRKANPLKKTLFSIIVPQHQQIVDWLGTLPFVDPERIAFYGLSYGGKTAMRVPPLVAKYCLSICSADFNDWVWKNASTRSPYSYVWTGEYEIFEFDLGSTFNYAEMAALIAPRPFMVERGHFDGVAPDEAVAYEFAKVRHLYNGRLGIGERCEIEWFAGGHTINGKGAFDFLHEHLGWPQR